MTIGIVSLATAMTVCTLNIHHKGTRGKLVPPWIQFVCFKILARLFCIPIEYPDPEILNEVPLSDKVTQPQICTKYMRTYCSNTQNKGYSISGEG